MWGTPMTMESSRWPLPDCISERHDSLAERSTCCLGSAEVEPGKHSIGLILDHEYRWIYCMYRWMYYRLSNCSMRTSIIKLRLKITTETQTHRSMHTVGDTRTRSTSLNTSVSLESYGRSLPSCWPKRKTMTRPNLYGKHGYQDWFDCVIPWYWYAYCM